MQEFDKLTDDHIFPLSWYPDTTPENISKWKAPVCSTCNGDFGRIEEELRLRIAHCLGIMDSGAHGIVEKAMRSLKPGYGRSPDDSRRRLRKWEKIKKEIMPAQKVPTAAILPGFGLKWDQDLLKTLAIEIPRDLLERFAEKIVKGLTHVFCGHCIPSNYRIIVRLDSLGEFEDLLIKYGKHEARGPGIEVIYVKVADDTYAMAYKIVIWGKLVFYSYVLPTQ
ncbi:MAG: hypothetical protein NTV06_07035 [candidate division Zixibacteria bacterium]|nr:hypothetical protein [candidate division Zixibacteria bacterium]